MSEWTDYKIVFLKGSELPTDGSVLETVYHVVHVPVARRILEDGLLKAALVYDESRLRRSRIAVNWLSANTWANGSIYGNVQFSFPWPAQIEDRKFYWVEAMTRYSPHAYRILLTDRDLSQYPHVKVYNPASDKGPLRQRKGVWYWNHECTSEFMVEADISLENCTDVNFISHHKAICRPDGAGCPDIHAPNYHTAGRMIAFLLGHGKHGIDHVLKKPSIFDETRPLSFAVDQGVDGISRALGGTKERFGGTIASPDRRKAVLRGALALFGSGQTKAARELIKLLKNESVFMDALTDLVNGHFKITGWTPDK